MVRGSALVLGFGLSALLTGCDKPAPPAPTASDTAAAAEESVPAPVATQPTSTAKAPDPPPSIKLSGPAKLPDKLQAVGTEPFWNVRIAGSQLTYSTPEDQAGQTFTAAREDSAMGSTFRGRLTGKPFALTIAPEKCSDGMSDATYPFSARLDYDGQHRTGCARKGG